MEPPDANGSRILFLLKALVVCQECSLWLVIGVFLFAKPETIVLNNCIQFHTSIIYEKFSPRLFTLIFLRPFMFIDKKQLCIIMG